MQKVTHFHGSFLLEYKRSPGKIVGRFLSTLRDEARILAIRCAECNNGFLPPQAFCPDCRAKMQTFFAVPETGQVAYLTKVCKPVPFFDCPVPYYYIGIQFAGVNTVFWHRSFDDKLEIGDTIKAVFKDESERVGSILDIDHFTAVKLI